MNLFDDDTSEINIVPLVDVFLVLLVIFITLSVLYSKTQTSHESIDIPTIEKTSGKFIKGEKIVNLTSRKEHCVFWGTNGRYKFLRNQKEREYLLKIKEFVQNNNQVKEINDLIKMTTICRDFKIPGFSLEKCKFS